MKQKSTARKNTSNGILKRKEPWVIHRSDGFNPRLTARLAGKAPTRRVIRRPWQHPKLRREETWSVPTGSRRNATRNAEKKPENKCPMEKF
jgi:hypothetical protein